MTRILALVALSLFSLSHLSVASSLNWCPLNPNDTVSTSSNITWQQVANQTIKQFDGPSYLRPDIGGALLPWVYSIVVLLVHIPVVIIRVVRWQTVQTWCLAASLFTVVLTAQAYASTSFGADKILTWTPLLLVIDAGSMAQIIFLIVEDSHLFTRLRAIFPSGRRFGDILLHGLESGELMDSGEEPTVAVRCVEEAALSPAPEAGPSTITNLPPLFTSKPLYIALVSFLLLIAVFIMQILGLYHAVHASKASPPMVSWCSPIFQPFGVAVLDGNCNIWPVLQTFNKGVGCISIPGHHQMSWLKATVVGTGLSIALELMDICILATVHSGTRWRGMKMRRPWFTMISGVTVLGLLLVFGLIYSTMLPPGISERVWVIGYSGSVTVYRGKLGTAGLRGAMIGWNDGVFEDWGTTYFGSWAVQHV